MKVCLIFFLAFSFAAIAAEQYGVYDAKGNRISNFEAEVYELLEKIQTAKEKEPNKILYVSSLSKGKNSKPTSRYRYKAEIGAYIEATRKETFSVCPDKEIQGTWISEHSVSLNAENCISIQTPNLAGTFRVLFLQNSGKTDTIQVLVDQSYIQMGDYSHKIWRTNLDYKKITVLGNLLYGPWGSWENIFSNGYYESKNYNQPLIIDKTKLTMGDALYYNKIDTSIIVHWTFKKDEYKNIKLEESNLPLIHQYQEWKIANERSKKEGLDTAYIKVKPNSEETKNLILLGNPADYTCKFCTTMFALDTSASGYRSPFEEEWMLLMRAGASTRYYWGDNKDSRYVSRYERISPIGLKPVAQLQPNGFGLYDMIGIAHESVISDFYKDWWDWGGNCDHNLSPECIYMEEISPEINYEKRTKKVYYQGLRLIRKTPKLHKLEKF